MATPIRESCLIQDPDNEDKFIINSTGRAVLHVINEDSGCLYHLKGQACGLDVHWFGLEDWGDPNIGCCVDHAEEAYHPDVYGQIVAKTIHSHIPTAGEQEEEDSMENYSETRMARLARLARQEADKLGEVFKEGREGVSRPEGKAPDGKTWSYLFGHWNDADWLVKRKAVDLGDGEEKRVKKKIAGTGSTDEEKLGEKSVKRAWS